MLNWSLSTLGLYLRLQSLHENYVLVEVKWKLVHVQGNQNYPQLDFGLDLGFFGMERSLVLNLTDLEHQEHNLIGEPCLTDLSLASNQMQYCQQKKSDYCFYHPQQLLVHYLMPLFLSL